MRSFFVVFALASLFPSVVFAVSVEFARMLRVGMRGEDVRALQVVLNSDPETRIASVGAGSPGNETDYFGLGTMRSLIKFQEKYRSEVLTPVGLTRGTGVFGEKTRAKATLMRQKGNNPSLSTQTSTLKESTNTLLPAGAPALNFFSAYTGLPGSTFSISGENFAAKNTILFGGYAITGVVSKDGTTLSVVVPSLTPGVYSVHVANEKGKDIQDRIFAITKKGAIAPKLDGVTPMNAVRGSVLILRGGGFVQANTVRTSVGDFPSRMVDESTLTFTLPETVMSYVVASSTSKLFLPVYIYVLNENGISNAQNFTLEL